MTAVEFKKLAKVKGVPWSDHRYGLVCQNRGIPFTPTEYKLIYPLRQGVPVTYDDLAHAVYGCSMDDKVRKMLDRHIDSIRHKIIQTGFYVYCVLDYGYMLLPSRKDKDEKSRV